MVFDGESFHLISFSRATWRMRCSLVEGLHGDNSSTKETCSRRSFAGSLVGVERTEVGSGIVDGCRMGNCLSRVSSQESYTPMGLQKRPDQ
jgi:hypothetical protein